MTTCIGGNGNVSRCQPLQIDPIEQWFHCIDFQTAEIGASFSGPKPSLQRNAALIWPSRNCTEVRPWFPY